MIDFNPINSHWFNQWLAANVTSVDLKRIVLDLKMIYNCFCTSLPPFHRLSAYLAPFCVCLNFRVWFCSPQHQRSPTMWNKSDVLRFPWLIKSPLISLWKRAPYALQSESGCTSVRRVHCGMEPIASGQKNKQDVTHLPVHFYRTQGSDLWVWLGPSVS